MLRKCVGCGKLEDATKMIKLTREHKTGEVIKSPSSTVFGRSAYLCYNQSCIEQSLKKNKLNKVLRTNNTCENLKGLLNGQFKS
jgi:predicted RNA-binding protein YlxR (DUF448 family)